MSPSPVKRGWGLLDGMCQILGQSSSCGSLQVVQESRPGGCPSWGYTYFTVNSLWFKKGKLSKSMESIFAKNLIVYLRLELQSVRSRSRALSHWVLINLHYLNISTFPSVICKCKISLLSPPVAERTPVAVVTGWAHFPLCGYFQLFVLYRMPGSRLHFQMHFI